MTACRTTSASSDHALANFCACTSGHSPVERRYWTSTNRRPSVSSNETTCLPMVSSDRESPGIAIMVPSGNLDSPPCARRQTREVGSSDLFVEGGSAEAKEAFRHVAGAREAKRDISGQDQGATRKPGFFHWPAAASCSLCRRSMQGSRLARQSTGLRAALRTTLVAGFLQTFTQLPDFRIGLVIVVIEP